ncbi:carbohydrate-binding protein [Cellulosimicrobium sp. CUA-896]|uniref:carbohydrate-binding protein n=1 Tax=Cellulosimicrobium sp. CUA-896 TaxID=1517881 RepID=UPI003511DA8F
MARRSRTRARLAGPVVDDGPGARRRPVGPVGGDRGRRLRGVGAWKPSRVYVQGDVVVHDGTEYTAKWWTRNQEPGDRWGPWEPSS